jgi:hypothetical protein
MAASTSILAVTFEVGNLSIIIVIAAAIARKSEAEVHRGLVVSLLGSSWCVLSSFQVQCMKDARVSKRQQMAKTTQDGLRSHQMCPKLRMNAGTRRCVSQQFGPFAVRSNLCWHGPKQRPLDGRSLLLRLGCNGLAF